MAWFRRSQKMTTVTVKKKRLWTVCPSCKSHIFTEEWVENSKICPKCNFHDKITYQERLALLIDEGTFAELDADITTSDPLEFSDGKGTYADKSEQSRAKTKMSEAVVTCSRFSQPGTYLR